MCTIWMTEEKVTHLEERKIKRWKVRDVNSFHRVAGRQIVKIITNYCALIIGGMKNSMFSKVPLCDNLIKLLFFCYLTPRYFNKPDYKSGAHSAGLPSCASAE